MLTSQNKVAPDQSSFGLQSLLDELVSRAASESFYLDDKPLDDFELSKINKFVSETLKGASLRSNPVRGLEMFLEECWDRKLTNLSDVKERYEERLRLRVSYEFILRFFDMYPSSRAEVTLSTFDKILSTWRRALEINFANLEKLAAHIGAIVAFKFSSILDNPSFIAYRERFENFISALGSIQHANPELFLTCFMVGVREVVKICKYGLGPKQQADSQTERLLQYKDILSSILNSDQLGALEGAWIDYQRKAATQKYGYNQEISKALAELSQAENLLTQEHSNTANLSVIDFLGFLEDLEACANILSGRQGLLLTEQAAKKLADLKQSVSKMMGQQS